jgi:hypothetical protein
MSSRASQALENDRPDGKDSTHEPDFYVLFFIESAYRAH